jgi:hypothetical protein
LLRCASTPPCFYFYSDALSLIKNDHQMKEGV